jgi:hypothetical protein
MAFKAFLLSVFLLAQINVSAQYRQVIHKTFELTDSTMAIEFKISGEVTYQTWSGNVVMTETAIELLDASASIFTQFIKDGRYEILAATPSANKAPIAPADSLLYAEARATYDSTQLKRLNNTLSIFSKIQIRPTVKVTRSIEGNRVERPIQEWVQVKVFIPEEFEPKNEARTFWLRKPEEKEEAGNK